MSVRPRVECLVVVSLPGSEPLTVTLKRARRSVVSMASAQIIVDSKSYSFSLVDRIAAHASIPVFERASKPTPSNVFGLSPALVITEKGTIACILLCSKISIYFVSGEGYRVQDGASINCMPIHTFPHEGTSLIHYAIDLAHG